MDAVQDWELPIAPRRPRRPQIRVERERPCDYRQPVCVTDSSVHSAGVEPLAPRGCHPLNMWARRLSSSGPARQGRPTEATERRVLSCATPLAWRQGAERNLEAAVQVRRGGRRVCRSEGARLPFHPLSDAFYSTAGPWGVCRKLGKAPFPAQPGRARRFLIAYFSPVLNVLERGS